MLHYFYCNNYFDFYLEVKNKVIRSEAKAVIIIAFS